MPEFMKPYLETEEIRRLRGVNMNCGMNFTSFDLYRSSAGYSRYIHSAGAALIIYHFTHDKAQALSGLFHDITTPAFSHVIDFMYGDHISQEKTECNTSLFLQKAYDIRKLLRDDGIEISEVDDYHRYPVADNDMPALSADRLEYTCGNTLNYGFAGLEDIRRYYNDLIIMKNENGKDEPGFMHQDIAAEFSTMALKCGNVYSGNENRYSMEFLAEIFKKAFHGGIIVEKDLYMDENTVLAKLIDSSLCDETERFMQLKKVSVCSRYEPGCLKVAAKKRYIDPLVGDGVRLSEADPKMKQAFEAFRNTDHDIWLKGE